MKIILRRYLLATVAAAASFCVPAARAVTYTTNFADGIDPTYFTVTQSTAGLYTVDTSQGNVQLARAGNPNPSGLSTVNVNLNMSAVGGAITGDFSTSVDFANAVVPGPGFDQVQLNVLFADGTSYDFLGVYDNGGGGLNVHVHENQNYTTNGVIPVSVNSRTFTVTRTGSIAQV